MVSARASFRPVAWSRQKPPGLLCTRNRIDDGAVKGASCWSKCRGPALVPGPLGCPTGLWAETSPLHSRHGIRPDPVIGSVAHPKCQGAPIDRAAIEVGRGLTAHAEQELSEVGRALP